MQHEYIQVNSCVSEIIYIAEQHHDIDLSEDKALQFLTEWGNEIIDLLWEYFSDKLGDWRNEND